MDAFVLCLRVSGSGIQFFIKFNTVRFIQGFGIYMVFTRTNSVYRFKGFTKTFFSCDHPCKQEPQRPRDVAGELGKLIAPEAFRVIAW